VCGIAGLVRFPGASAHRAVVGRMMERLLPGLEPWLAGRKSQVPRHIDGMVWSLLTLPVWSREVGAE